LLRVRLIWFPAVVALFALAVVGLGRLASIEGGAGIVVAGFLVTVAVLATGLLWRFLA
jgi:hypothetical protein